MLLEPSSDQEIFRETTARFLDDRVPPEELRRLREDHAGYDGDYWRRGADLGWTSLLVGEDRGGGSVGGVGLVDLTLVAYEFGRRAAPGPLLPTNIVAAALDAHPADERADVLSGLLDGSLTAAWCPEPPGRQGRSGTSPVEVRASGSDVVLSGALRPVEAAVTADVLLVSGRTGDGLTQVLVPRDAPGLGIDPLTSVDVTRRYAAVRFDDVRLPATALVGPAGEAAADVERVRLQALVVSCAESVGALQAAFDMTVAWTLDRYSFGRPLASYQAIKHRLADLKTWLEGSHAVADQAAVAVAQGSADSARFASAAKAFIGEYGGELMQECVQIHGGIGLTYEHDLHLVMRRAAANRASHGTPAEHRRLLADIVEAEEVA